MGQTCPRPLPAEYIVITCRSNDGRNIHSLSCAYVCGQNNISYSLTFDPGEPFGNQASLLEHLLQYWHSLTHSVQRSYPVPYEHTSSNYGYNQHILHCFIFGLAVTLFLYHLLSRNDCCHIFHPFKLSHPEATVHDDLQQLHQGSLGINL